MLFNMVTKKYTRHFKTNALCVHDIERHQKAENKGKISFQFLLGEYMSFFQWDDYGPLK